MIHASLWQQYLAALVPFVLIDLLWLGVIAKGFYRHELGDLMREPIGKGAALAFYLLYPLGLLVFVFPQAGTGSVAQAFIYGALLGLLTYGTYDLTNLATMRVLDQARARGLGFGNIADRHSCGHRHGNSRPVLTARTPASVTETQTVGFPDGLRASGNPHPGSLPVEDTA